MDCPSFPELVVPISLEMGLGEIACPEALPLTSAFSIPNLLVGLTEAGQRLGLEAQQVKPYLRYGLKPLAGGYHLSYIIRNHACKTGTDRTTQAEIPTSSWFVSMDRSFAMVSNVSP